MISHGQMQIMEKNKKQMHENANKSYPASKNTACKSLNKDYKQKKYWPGIVWVEVCVFKMEN